MYQGLNPLLLPNQAPDAAEDHCSATLLNPPHLNRLTWDAASRPHLESSNDAPDWSLLHQPAA